MVLGLGCAKVEKVEFRSGAVYIGVERSVGYCIDINHVNVV